jgi:hypothetical protein
MLHFRLTLPAPSTGHRECSLLHPDLVLTPTHPYSSLVLHIPHDAFNSRPDDLPRLHIIPAPLENALGDRM